jgi:hypothetical protein
MTRANLRLAHCRVKLTDGCCVDENNDGRGESGAHRGVTTERVSQVGGGFAR